MVENAGLLSIAYPLMTGVCIITFAHYSKLFLNEHFGPKEIAGVAVGIAGIVAMSAG